MLMNISAERESCLIYIQAQNPDGILNTTYSRFPLPSGRLM